MPQLITCSLVHYYHDEAGVSSFCWMCCECPAAQLKAIIDEMVGMSLAIAHWSSFRVGGSKLTESGGEMFGCAPVSARQPETHAAVVGRR